MKTIQEIKDEVAKEAGYNDWGNFNYEFGGDSSSFFEPYLDKVIKRYVEEALIRASEKAMILFHDGTTKENKSLKYFQSGADNIQPDKDSILNILKEIK